MPVKCLSTKVPKLASEEGVGKEKAGNDDNKVDNLAKQEVDVVLPASYAKPCSLFKVFSDLLYSLPRYTLALVTKLSYILLFLLLCLLIFVIMEKKSR